MSSSAEPDPGSKPGPSLKLQQRRALENSRLGASSAANASLNLSTASNGNILTEVEPYLASIYHDLRLFTIFVTISIC